MTEPIEDAAPAPMPTPIVWDALDAFDFQATLLDLTTWVRWLVITYSIPESTIPPCWFAHPDIREELTHLWLGWQQAHHPSMGLGRTGMDWDTGRDQCLARVAIMAQCGSQRGHNAITIPALPAWSITQFHEHLQHERAARTLRGIRAARHAAATEVLQDYTDAVNQSVDDALTAAGGPAAASPETILQAERAVTEALLDIAAAAGAAADTAADSLIAEDQRIIDQQCLSTAETALAAQISENTPNREPAVTHWIRRLLHLDDPATTVRRVITKAKRAARAAAKQPPDLTPPD